MLVDILSITLTFLLLFFLSRGVVDMYIQKQIKNRRHREERKKGQSFWEWLFYKRFRDILPKSAYVCWVYYTNIALYFLLLIGVVLLHLLGGMESWQHVIFKGQLAIIGIPLASCFAALGGNRKK